MSESQFSHLWILLKTAWRRWLNRVFSRWPEIKKKKLNANSRPAVSRKRKIHVLLLGITALAFIFNSLLFAKVFFQNSVDMLHATSETPKPPFLLSESTFQQLSMFEIHYRFIDSRLQGRGDKFLRKIFRWEENNKFTLGKRGESPFRDEKINKMILTYHIQGLNGFKPRTRSFWTTILPDPELWPKGNFNKNLRAITACWLIAFSLALLCVSLGVANRDFSSPGWSLEWLFTFPISSGVLFLAKIFEYAMNSFLGWLILWPFLLSYFWFAGFGYWAALWAVLATFQILFVVAAARILLETIARTKWQCERRRNAQAFFAAFGMGLMAISYATLISERGSWFLDLVAQLFGDIVLLTPSGFVTVWTGSQITVIEILSTTVATSTLFASTAIWICNYYSQKGLFREGNYFRRDAVPDTVGSKYFGRGIVRKEILLLSRDRALFVRCFLVPVFVAALQVAINPDLITMLSVNFNHAAMLAFGFGAYALLFSSLPVLALEGEALWLLYTFPERLEKILLKKALFWGTLSLIFPIIVLAWALTLTVDFSVSTAISSIMAVVGIFIYAIIGVGIGALGTDVFEKEPRRKIKPSIFYLFTIISGMYSYAIYASAINVKITMLALCALLACAIWQKVRQNLPLLLDPTQTPEPNISLFDALFATLLFFVFQGAFRAILENSFSMSTGPAIMLGFLSGGFFTTIASCLYFRFRGVPNFMTELGLKSNRSREGASFAAILTKGVIWALPALLFGGLYYYFLRKFSGVLPFPADSACSRSDADLYWWVSVAAIIAAPIFEEYLFRGLLFQSLRQSVSWRKAMVLNSAIFAIIHTPISMPSVFIMSICATMAFVRTRSLIAPIIVHFLYNAYIIYLQ